MKKRRTQEKEGEERKRIRGKGGGGIVLRLCGRKNVKKKNMEQNTKI